MRGNVNPQQATLLKNNISNIRDKKRNQYLLSLIQDHKSFLKKSRD